jgi:hypothetical protein
MHRINGTWGTSNSNQWSYQWQAPSTSQGAITFYACFVAANGNDSCDSNDQVYYTSLVINPCTVGIESSAEEEIISLYPNPAKKSFYIKYTLSKPRIIKSELISLQGQLVQELIPECQLQGDNAEKITLNKSISAGIYFVKTKIDDKERLQKIIIE